MKPNILVDRTVTFYPWRVAAWLLAIVVLTLGVPFVQPMAGLVFKVLAGLYFVCDLTLSALQRRWDRREAEDERSRSR